MPKALFRDATFSSRVTSSTRSGMGGFVSISTGLPTSTREEPGLKFFISPLLLEGTVSLLEISLRIWSFSPSAACSSVLTLSASGLSQSAAGGFGASAPFADEDSGGGAEALGTEYCPRKSSLVTTLAGFVEFDFCSRTLRAASVTDSAGRGGS